MSYDIQTVHGVLLFFTFVSLMLATAPVEIARLLFYILFISKSSL